MQAALKIKIKKLIDNVGRKEAARLLEEFGVSLSTREKLFAGCYEHKPKGMLRKAIDNALKKGA